MSSCVLPRQDQVEIAELVPLVAGFDGSKVRVGDDIEACDGVEHGEVGGVRLVPSCDQAVDDVHVVLGCDHEVRPSTARVSFAAGCC